MHYHPKTTFRTTRDEAIQQYSTLPIILIVESSSMKSSRDQLESVFYLKCNNPLLKMDLYKSNSKRGDKIINSYSMQID